MAKIRSYGGNFIDPSLKSLMSGKAESKRVPNLRVEVSMPTYPDSVEGQISEQRSGVTSNERHINKRNNRFS